jgi:hypothetical protein
MANIPTKTVRVTAKEIQGLQCRHCGFGIGMGGDLDRLPETFEATCPMCKQSATYQRGEIQTLQVVQKQ